MHGVRRPPLPDFRRAALQLPGALQVPSGGRLQHQRLPGQGSQRWPPHQVVLVDEDRVPDSGKTLDHADAGLRGAGQQGGGVGAVYDGLRVHDIQGQL